MEIRSDLKYTKDHEWVLIEGETLTLGISDFAQAQLGDIVFVELPEVGTVIDESVPNTPASLPVNVRYVLAATRRVVAVVPSHWTTTKYRAGPSAEYGAVSAISWNALAPAETVPASADVATTVPALFASPTIRSSVPTVAPFSTPIPVMD